MRNNIKKMMLIFISCYMISGSVLAEKKFPRGCEVKGFVYQENYLILNEEGKQTFYLIQNTSDSTIELERHETRDVFMSPSLKKKINPSRWAAFASDIQDLHFKCYSNKENNIAMINCSDVLEVCQYPRVKFALSNMGNYWVSANKPQSKVIKDAIAKGILLRW